MNQFVQKFGEQIKHFYDIETEAQEQKLLDEIVEYANSDPETFKKELAEVQFDDDLDPLDVVMQALAKDLDNWGDWFVELTDVIIRQAEQLPDPELFLINLWDFDYIKDDHRPFVQKIVDRLYKETDSNNPAIQLAAISEVVSFFENPSIRNKAAMTASLQQKLNDPNWKVRYATFQALKDVNLLPEGATLSFMDKLRKKIFGDPT